MLLKRIMLVLLIMCVLGYTYAQTILKIDVETFIVEDFEYSFVFDRELDIFLKFEKDKSYNTLYEIKFVCNDETDIWCEDFSITNIEFIQLIQHKDKRDYKYEFKGYINDKEYALKLIMNSREVVLYLEDDICKQIYKKEIVVKI